LPEQLASLDSKVAAINRGKGQPHQNGGGRGGRSSRRVLPELGIGHRSQMKDGYKNTNKQFVQGNKYQTAMRNSIVELQHPKLESPDRGFLPNQSARKGLGPIADMYKNRKGRNVRRNGKKVDDIFFGSGLVNQ